MLINAFKRYCNRKRIMILTFIYLFFFIINFYFFSNQNSNLHNRAIILKATQYLQRKGPPNFVKEYTPSRNQTFKNTTKISKKELNPQHKLIFNKNIEEDTVIYAKHVCLNNQGILFYPLKNKEEEKENKLKFPEINISGSSIGISVYFKLSTQYVDEDTIIYLKKSDLFVLGKVWEFHLSHFFVNNMMPLINNINQFYQSTDWKDRLRDLYVYEGSYFDIESMKFDAIWPRKKLNLEEKEIICFENAIIGLNNTCDCCGCINEFGDEKIVYNQMREMVLSNHLDQNQYHFAQSRKVEKNNLHAIIVQRALDRRILNVKEVSKYLEERGISNQIVQLEGMSFKDQVKLFSMNASMYICSVRKTFV